MEQIEYTRTVVPSSMRSPYWKYFGFPSDSGNNILTRQKIVCTICNTAIAYNKNTSNLRTHLMSKHVEIFQKIVTASSDLVPKQDLNAEEQITMTKERVIICDPKNVISNSVNNNANIKRRRSGETGNFVETFLTIPEYCTNIETRGCNTQSENNSTSMISKVVDVEIQSTDYITFAPANGEEAAEAAEDSLANAENVNVTKNEEIFTYTDVELHDQQEQQLHSMDIMLADMVQADLLPLDTLENNGFCKYNQQLTGVKLDHDTVKRVMEVIEMRFVNTNQVITAHVVRISQIQPYSLCQTQQMKSFLRPRCHWNRLNFLDHIFKNKQFEKCAEFRESFEYLKPLKMALDIITDEHLPLCTLVRPLIIKLFEEHFSSINHEESVKIFKIQKILEKELYERVMVQSFLNEATFFDTRFHRDFALQESSFDITNIKSQVHKRFKHILQVFYINKTQNVKTEQNSTDSSISARKCSSLKSFFKRDVTLTNTDINADLKTNLDLEFEQYQTEQCLDLDQSPALWWHQKSDNYKELSKVAKRYLTIPCCCLPRLCRVDMEQRYFKLDRRKNLSQFCNVESKLWYLYYNDAVAELI
ncbi:Zinc finger BED domain-containing protein 1 [Lucilia cuprina]|nr:Zinc finger BED domain-containing protein 1 [Lucilia cuprina]